MVNFEEILKETKKLETYEEKIEYLEGLIKITKDKELLEKIKQLIEKIKKENKKEQNKEIKAKEIKEITQQGFQEGPKIEFSEAPDIKYEPREERRIERVSELERKVEDIPATKETEEEIKYIDSITNYERIIKRDELENTIRNYLDHLNINPLIDREAARQAITKYLTRIGQPEERIETMIHSIVDIKRYETGSAPKTEVREILKTEEDKRKIDTKKYVVKGH